MGPNNRVACQGGKAVDQFHEEPILGQWLQFYGPFERCFHSAVEVQRAIARATEGNEVRPRVSDQQPKSMPPLRLRKRTMEIGVSGRGAI